jgi:hypothetical protein
MERNLTFNFMAIWATAPGDRFNFFAAWVPDNRLFANARRFFTSSFDHATNFRRDFAFAMISTSKKARIIARKHDSSLLGRAAHMAGSARSPRFPPLASHLVGTADEARSDVHFLSQCRFWTTAVLVELWTGI